MNIGAIIAERFGRKREPACTTTMTHRMLDAPPSCMRVLGHGERVPVTVPGEFTGKPRVPRERRQI